MGNIAQSCFKPTEDGQIKNKRVPTEKELTMSRLLDQSDQLIDYKKKIEVQIYKQNNDIKELVKNKEKSRAMHLINRKKLLETQLDTIYQKENLIKSMTLQLESTMRQAEFNSVIKESNNLIKNIQDQIDMSVLDDQQDLLQDQKQMRDQLKDYAEKNENQDEIDELYQQYEDAYCIKQPVVQTEIHQQQQIQNHQPIQQSEQIENHQPIQQSEQKIAMLQ